MIVVEITDGLGNQMFQYALAKSLAVKNNTNVVIDMSWNEINKFRGQRKYQLDIFKLECEKINVLGKSGNFFLKYLHFTRNIFRRIARFKIKKMVSTNMFFIENELLKNEDILTKSGDMFLKGYWHKEKYFHDIRTILLDDFSFRDDFDKKNIDTFNLIKSLENTVSIHIRRGDYLQTEFNILNNDYYSKAIEYIYNKLGKTLNIFVFSNDVAWAKDNIKSDVHNIIFVNNNDEDHGYNDMRLMSICDHNIIANSTFSWWSAWLNKNDNKIVIAPKKWYKNEAARDIILPEWISL